MVSASPGDSILISILVKSLNTGAVGSVGVKVHNLVPPTDPHFVAPVTPPMKLTSSPPACLNFPKLTWLIQILLAQK